MRKLTLFSISLIIMLFASPAYAIDLNMELNLDGDFSVGVGGGWGDEDIGPIVLSGKYHDDWLEIGTDWYLDNDTEDEIDQLVLLYLIYRLDLHQEENNTPWIGVGFGELFENNNYEDAFGLIAAMGWEGRGWGMEVKYGYFDPSLYSFIIYYNF